MKSPCHPLRNMIQATITAASTKRPNHQDTVTIVITAEINPKKKAQSVKNIGAFLYFSTILHY